MEFPVASVRRRFAGGLALVGVVIALGGCGSAANVPHDPNVPRPTPTVSLPAGGVSLADLGFRNGPADRVSLPPGVRLDLRVDQPNVITATINEPGGARVAGWLRASLPAGGFTVSADAGDSLLFAGYGWSGAYTTSDHLAALTLRKDPTPG